MSPYSEPKVAIGVVLGQNQDRAALCVVEAKKLEKKIRLKDGRFKRQKQQHFYLRLLERLPVGVQWQDVAARLSEVVGNLYDRRDQSPEVIYIDTTGLGLPVLEFFREALPGETVEGIFLTQGDLQSEEDERIRLGKSAMVSRMKALLAADRLEMPETDKFKGLASELKSFQLDKHESSSDRLFRMGANDDQITAIGMAVHQDLGSSWGVY